jgi:flagellar assembly protein FliH
MSAPQRFLFDQSFDKPEPARGVRKPVAAEPTFSAAELAAARAEGRAEARAEALAEAAAASETRIAAAATALEQSIATLLAQQIGANEQASRTACEALRALLRKAVPGLARKAPLLEIEAVLGECLREAFDEPRLVMRVGDAVFDDLQRRLAGIVSNAGFAGKVVLLADDTLAPGDARVEWAEGGAERDTKRLMENLDEALARALDALNVPGTSPREEKGHE